MSSSTAHSSKSERARQRWAILRLALLGHNGDGDGDGDGNEDNGDNNTCNDGAVNSASIHRFEGFRLLDRRQLLKPPEKDARKRQHELVPKDEDGPVAQEDEHDYEYEYAEYTIPVPAPLHAPVPEAEAEFTASSGSDSNTCNNTTIIRVRTRERRRRRQTHSQDCASASADNSNNKKKRIDQVMRGLLSHRLHGVDNTGQSCVWDSESTLTHCLWASRDLPPSTTSRNATCSGDGDGDGDGGGTAANADGGGNITTPYPLGIDNILSLASEVSSPSPSDDNNGIPAKRLRVVELGAGMAGLCGLSLAAFGMMSERTDIDIQLTLTDGHPDAVRSNQICAALTSQLYASATNNDSNGDTPNRNRITCQRLLWNDGQDGVEECRALTNHGQNQYQLCLASDCVHFQEFHAALVATIGRLLDVGGVCLLCQPRRADSLANFMKVVNAVNACSSAAEQGSADCATTNKVFEMNLHERYNQRLWDLHQTELARVEDGIYDPDIHYPMLLVLKKVGVYDEETHTAAAIEHVRERR